MSDVFAAAVATAEVPKASEEKFTFFWSGPFSQWHMGHPFVVEGIEFPTAEHFMMYKKASLFGDVYRADKVLKAYTPREAKAIGRQVNPFDETTWNSVVKDLVFVGNMAKFTQHPDLLRILMNTYGTTLVEASPKDSIWGIGLVEDDPRAKSRETWLGKNWLGETLTGVRDAMALVAQVTIQDVKADLEEGI